MRRLAALIAALFLAQGAHAAQLTVVVRTPKGAPVVDAVVTVQPAGGGSTPRGYGQPLQLAQHNRMFEPFVLVVPLGAQVSFPNRDPFHHQVYFFSPAKKFELKLYSHDENPTVVFDKPGIVAVGCDIHDTMVAFIALLAGARRRRLDHNAHAHALGVEQLDRGGGEGRRRRGHGAGGGGGPSAFRHRSGVHRQ